MSEQQWRPEVRAFADLMEATLRDNDDKGGWKDCSLHWLAGRLKEEVAELEDARLWKGDDGPMVGGYARALGRECADVANFAMMIADVCGALNPAKRGLRDDAGHCTAFTKADSGRIPQSDSHPLSKREGE